MYDVRESKIRKNHPEHSVVRRVEKLEEVYAKHDNPKHQTPNTQP
jgi:hypothetical protein